MFFCAAALMLCSQSMDRLECRYNNRIACGFAGRNQL
jgi:hypothetical protein